MSDRSFFNSAPVLWNSLLSHHRHPAHNSNFSTLTSRVEDSSQILETQVRLESPFRWLATCLRLGAKDLGLEVDLRLAPIVTWDLSSSQWSSHLACNGSRRSRQSLDVHVNYVEFIKTIRPVGIKRFTNFPYHNDATYYVASLCQIACDRVTWACICPAPMNL